MNAAIHGGQSCQIPAPHGKLGCRVVASHSVLAPELRCLKERHLLLTAEPPQGDAVG